ncbi:MAG: hypothetical protein JRI27_02050 [Deltaproteobacteria bacterium]|nr:hypothetical protein [Deltaproteobacteria bacterium]
MIRSSTAILILVLFLFFGNIFLLIGPEAKAGEIFTPKVADRSHEELARRDFMAVCPPFFLKDEDGTIIDPLHGINQDRPYSPKKTCGACHDYDLITSAYHFQQGKNEEIKPELAAAYSWMLSPGNYGGRYCTVAPNFRQLARKKNENAREIDLSSFEFAKACSSCHPGGGPLEYDRNGNRYDCYAKDPSNRIVPGGENGFDGDYFKSRWAESGVLEADCLLCHLPSYDHKAREAQIKALNFRWAASAGADFAIVERAVAQNAAPTIKYKTEIFQPDGKVALNIVREVPKEKCLNCHLEPDWKKKGEPYNHRTDIHLRAGLKCVDCHVTGRSATDERIAGQERHEIGKGDDPTGLVREDLNNSMRTCRDCHMDGLLKAPVPRHVGLPPRHLDKIACQTCHIRQRQVKAALMQDSTVFNAAPRIAKAGKRIWTFYGPDMKPWNLYGEASSFTDKRQPLFLYEPVRAWYKGQIYPMNRIDSIWIGILKSDGKGLDQPYMKDLYAMWTAHLKDPVNNFPELGKIKDDNGDSVSEANRPEEIQGLLAAVKRYLVSQGEPLDGRYVILVSGSRYTKDGIIWKGLYFTPKPWEYTAYASTFKLSHGISSASSALGAGGCTDCHGSCSSFWTRPVMKEPFSGEGAMPIFEPNSVLLGMSPLAVKISGFRHEILEPLLFYGTLTLLAGLLFFAVLYGGAIEYRGAKGVLADLGHRLMLGILGAVILGPAIIVLFGKLLPCQAMEALGVFHKGIGIVLVGAAFWLLVSSKSEKGLFFWLGILGIAFMTVTGATLMTADAISIRQIMFTLHDIGAVILSALAASVFLLTFLRVRKNA